MLVGSMSKSMATLPVSTSASGGAQLAGGDNTSAYPNPLLPHAAATLHPPVVGGLRQG